MVPFGYLIGLALVTLIASDTFDDREVLYARELPAPPRPPLPPPPPQSIPRGINLIFFENRIQNSAPTNLRSESLKDYLADYLRSDADGRSNLEMRRRGLEIYFNFCVPLYNPLANCRQIAQQVSLNDPLQNILDHRPDFEEILAQTHAHHAFEVNLDHLPDLWWQMGQGTSVQWGDHPVNVWNFLEQNVNSVIFRDSIPIIGDDVNFENAGGTSDRLLRKIILEVPHNSPDLLGHFFSLLHEAFHLYTSNTGDIPPRLLEERNAFIFEAKSIQSFLDLHSERLEEPLRWNLICQYVETKIHYLASNALLNLPESDDEIHFSLDREIPPDIADSYPTNYLEDYAHTQGFQNVRTLITEIAERMLREYSIASRSR